MSDDAERPTVDERPRGDATAHPTRDARPAGARPALASLPDRYAAGDELGRGGMGRVVTATDRMLGRVVAVKEALDTDEEALRRFARETQITARLEHPAIVPVYDAGVSPNGSPYYVMRKVTGRPLDKLVAAAARLEQRLALLPHVIAAAQALAHAHERGIIHRDLEPANILVGPLGETVVIDWGLAKALGEPDDPSTPDEPGAGAARHTRAGTVFGKPGFMSPEQLTSADVDERADVYALGATLYHVLAGRPPHAGATAEDTEAAARAAPPAPIATIVPGLPRALSTIVDKALAYDLDVRYRDARALVEDLTRFMLGQLVAAHDYSPRERLVRFVRRHRALVITIAAAVVLLAIAMRSILIARDEAVAQAQAAERARTRESERASDLVVSQARLLLETNPAAAVAMVRPLAATARWREVRAIAAGARASGVPWRLPGPAAIGFVAMSRDGMHGVACGLDGSVHVYDLAARTHQLVATFAPGPEARVRAVFLDDTHLVTWLDRTFTIIDLASHAQRTLARPLEIATVEAAGDVIYYTDVARRPWRLDVATGDARAIPTEGEVSQLALSPDGKWLALGGAHLWMVETRKPTLVDKLHDTKVFEISWDPTDRRIAVVGEHHTFDIRLHPEPAFEEHVVNQTATLARGLLYTTGMRGWLIADAPIGKADLGSSLLGLHVTRGEYVVAAARDALAVYDGVHPYHMPIPSPLVALQASPRSPYILGACGDLVLVWNIDDVMPQRREVPTFSQIVAVGLQHAWTISHDESRDLDLASLEMRALPGLSPLRYATTVAGTSVVGGQISSSDTLVIRPGAPLDKLPLEATFVIALDHERVALATREHAVAIHDLATHATSVLAKFPGPIEVLLARASNPRWLVAVLDDGTLWRHDATTGAITETHLAPRTDELSPGKVATCATRQGDVLFASGARLRRWHADGTTTDQVVLPRPIRRVVWVDDERVVVVTDDGTGFVARLDRPDDLRRLPTLGMSYATALTAPLLVTDDRTGGVTMIDLDANVAWKIARATPEGATPALSGDGTTVILRDASGDATAVAIWRLGLPQTPEATAAWITELTNASFDPRTGALSWP